MFLSFQKCEDITHKILILSISVESSPDSEGHHPYALNIYLLQHTSFKRISKILFYRNC